MHKSFSFDEVHFIFLFVYCISYLRNPCQIHEEFSVGVTKVLIITFQLDLGYMPVFKAITVVRIINYSD
jgi:hypothetical protein